MGLFDGPVMGFATKFCKHLDGRIVALNETAVKAKEVGDTFTALCDTIMAKTLEEVSTALRTIAGIE